MIVVSDTTPLNYLFEEKLDRLVKETTFYVTEEVLQEFRRRVLGQGPALEQQQPPQDPPAQK